MGPQPPFGWSVDRDDVPVQVTVHGALPSWLRGQLVRTAPGVYEVGAWKARHWFDGLALLYSFTFGGEGVQFVQRLLESETLKELREDDRSRASFRTPMVRGFFNRLFHPIPRTTDNTNVNVVPWEGHWLAMTETANQHVVDAQTLKTRGAYQFKDRFGRTTTSAHPFPNPSAKGSLVNVGSEMGYRNALVVFRQDTGTSTRVAEGRVRLERLPYVHSFGVSERFATLIDHPFTVSPRTMLWSNKGFVDHFEWAPGQGARLWKVDRRSGESKAYETDAFFCFHTINQFEEGDYVVLDLLAWSDPSIIAKLDLELLANGHPPITSKWVRARLGAGSSKVTLEPMAGDLFEFPVINLKRALAKTTRVAWGATITGSAEGGDAALLKVVPGEATRRFSAKGWTPGEPVMTPRPDATADDQGVLLSVASHAEGKKTALFVVDAESMSELARVEVDVGLPLGFHGSFRAAS